MKILAIDPGTTETAYVLTKEDLTPLEFGKIDNKLMLHTIVKLVQDDPNTEVAIEMIASYGQPVGNETFETCRWIGRFEECARINGTVPHFIYRREEKKALLKGKMCGTDKNIRDALIQKFAKFDMVKGKGTAKEKDFFYGFHADIWQAFAVAYTFCNKTKGYPLLAVSPNSYPNYSIEG